MSIIFGVDLGGTTVKLGRFDREGDLQEKWEIPTRKEEKGRFIFDDIAEAVLKNAEAAGFSLSDIDGIGMGLPGAIREDGYVEVCVNLGLRDFYPADEMSRRMKGIPVYCGNDANVAAMGEAWRGGGAGYPIMFMITLGTGVGGGAVYQGQILTGSKGLGGEFGHMVVRPEETEACSCGNRGCLEQVASATGIVREARRILESTDMPSILRGKENLSAREVLDAAKEGDPLASAVAKTMGRYLGWAMASVTHIIDPDVFVLGGGMSAAGEYLISMIRPVYDSMTHLSEKKADIVLARLGNDAGIYGAACLVLSK